MINLILILGMCTNYKIINNTNSWTSVDRQHLKIAAKRCGELYPGSCLKKFEKVEELTYRAICK